MKAGVKWLIGGIVGLILAVVLYMQYMKSRLRDAKEWFFSANKKQYDKAIDDLANGAALNAVAGGPEIIKWFRDYMKLNAANVKSNEVVLATLQKVARDIKGESSPDASFTYPFAANDSFVEVGLGGGDFAGILQAATTAAFNTYTDEQVANILRSSFLGGSKIGTMYKPHFWSEWSAYYEYKFKDEATAKQIALTAYDASGN